MSLFWSSVSACGDALGTAASAFSTPRPIPDSAPEWSARSYRAMPSTAAASMAPARLDLDSRISSVSSARSVVGSSTGSSPASLAAAAGSRRKRARNAESDSTRSISRAAASSGSGGFPRVGLMPGAPLADAVPDDPPQLGGCRRVALDVPVDNAGGAGPVCLAAAREL